MSVSGRRPNQPHDEGDDDEGIVADALGLLEANGPIGPVVQVTFVERDSVERVLVTVTQGSDAGVVARVHEVLNGLRHDVEFVPPGRGIDYGPPS